MNKYSKQNRRASDDPQDTQRDRQTQQVSSSSAHLVVFFWCVVFQERMVHVASTKPAPPTGASCSVGTSGGASSKIQREPYNGRTAIASMQIKKSAGTNSETDITVLAGALGRFPQTCWKASIPG